MATNFPTSLDTLTNPAAGNALNSPSHSAQHISENDAIEALEAKVGIDGSAVTTSHDYKLSEVTSTDKAVGKTATQTLTNKTLTSPTINLGTNATGDMYYRDSGGTFQRLPIGTALQVLNVDASGIPAWVANPSATTASQTAAGIIEIATTAEQTTGTDDTRAATPKSVHDMTSLAGAAWFLDEDTMSSNSDTKTASQQSIKAYADTKATSSDVPNTTATQTDWFTWSVSVLVDASDVPVGWETTGTPTNSSSLDHGGAGYAVIAGSGGGGLIVAASVPGNGSSDKYTAVSSKDIKVKNRVQFDTTPSAGNSIGFGFADATATLDDDPTSTATNIRFVNQAGTLYAVNSNGTTNTATNISSGLTITNWNTYEIVFNPGTNILFYVNGVLKATHTTNLPTGSLQYFGYGTEVSDSMLVSPNVFSLEL